jgi:hypothetical protein
MRPKYAASLSARHPICRAGTEPATYSQRRTRTLESWIATCSTKWLSVAEKKAKLSKLDGSLWHEYRRKWAIERKHRPLRDVAAAGGWKEVDTLLEVYQQADEASVLAGTPTGGMPGIP